jgi:molybdenum cofactor biosynthesis protein B
MSEKGEAFRSLNIAVLTVSDTRTEETDTSGKALVEMLTAAGHQLAEKAILADDKYAVRALVAKWIADDAIRTVLITGGTGMTGRDITPEAVTPLFDKTIDGFGELFRYISYQEIGTSTIQSRAVGGISNGTLVFCLPGSTGACRTAWNGILQEQLNLDHKPCNFIEVMPRLKER